jgi:hypothetical protein
VDAGTLGATKKEKKSVKSKTLLLSLIIILSSCTKNEFENGALNFLKENYELDWEGGQGSKDLKNRHVFIQKGKIPILKKIEVPFLTEKIKYEFFETTLKTVHFEAPLSISTIGVNIEKNQVNMLNSFLPKSEKEFINIFKGLEANSEKEKLIATKEIGDLLNTYINKDGELKLTQNKEKDFDEFIYNDEYNVLTLRFIKNKLSKIKLKNSITEDIILESN